MSIKNRLDKAFATARQKNRAALVTFIMGGDPDQKTFEEILNRLPEAGADIIEIGMPFSDPMADGPAIQEAGTRALKNGANLKKLIAAVKKFREKNQHTGIVLMGYYNPVFIYGQNKFLKDASNAGIDGVLIVDLPPEEDLEFSSLAKKSGIAFIKLIAPTTGKARLALVLEKASGFVYYVSIAGITGTKSANIKAVEKSIASLRKFTDLPVAVGFGIKTPAQAKDFAKFSDGVVVGSALIRILAENINKKSAMVNKITKFVKDLSSGMAKK